MGTELGFCRGTAIRVVSACTCVCVCVCSLVCFKASVHDFIGLMSLNLQGWPAGWRPRQSGCSASEGPLQGTSLLPGHSSLFPLKAFN